MNEDIYENYNDERYIHYRLIPTGEFDIIPQKRHGKEINVRRPIFEKRKVSFEEIKALNLDDYGQDVRTCAEDFQLIHNYFFDYWGSILGSTAVVLYLHLKRYCYGKRDYCFPNVPIIQEKMKIGSRSTINDNIATLEQYGFISKILRKDTERNNTDSSPFYKVRRYIPLLSEDLVYQLPDRLREEHDNFIANTKGITLEANMNTDKIIDNLMKDAEVMKSKSQEEKEESLKRQGKLKEYIFSIMSGEVQEDWFILLHSLKTRVSIPSFATWFKNSVIMIDKNTKSLIVVCDSSLSKDWIANNYKDMIIEEVRNSFNFNLISFDCITYNEYIDRLPK